MGSFPLLGPCAIISAVPHFFYFSKFFATFQPCILFNQVRLIIRRLGLCSLGCEFESAKGQPFAPILLLISVRYAGWRLSSRSGGLHLLGRPKVASSNPQRDNFLRWFWSWLFTPPGQLWYLINLRRTLGVIQNKPSNYFDDYFGISTQVIKQFCWIF